MAGLVAFGESALRCSPPADEQLEMARDLRVRVDGAESNAAVAAARLGLETTWLSKLPDDALGRRVVSELREAGLDATVVWSSTGRQGFTFREAGRGPRYDVVIQDRTETAMETVEPGELPMGTIEGADALFVGGSTAALGSTARDTVGAVLRACNGTRVLDLDYRPGLWSAENARETLTDLLDSVDVLIANEDDIEQVLGRSGAPREVVHVLASTHDLDRAVITRSEFGAVGWHDNVIHEQDGIDPEAVDPAGQHAGFVGGFLYALLAGMGMADALAWGVAAGAMTRTLPGPLPAISRPEVQRLVDRHAAGR